MNLEGVGLLQSRGVRQLIKFCLVGATSTIVDKGSLWFLLKQFPTVPWWMLSTISFCLGVTNGFTWNSRWTFRSQENATVNFKEQYPKFLLTNIVGLLLNLGITKFFLVLFTGQVLHTHGNPTGAQVIIASLCAIPIVVFWNFTASKYWTFRAPRPTPDETMIELKL